MSKENHLSLIINSLNRERRYETLAAIVLILVGAFVSFHCFDDNIMLAIVGLGILIGGIRYIYQLVRRPIFLPQLIQQNSRQIVWVYPMVTQRMPFGLQFSRQACIYFKLLDGEEVTVTIKEQELKGVMQMLNLKLPHASFGYSADKEQWYTVDPAMMYREEGSKGMDNKY